MVLTDEVLSLRSQTPARHSENPKLEPDIVDWTRRIWLEIKPLSPWGVVDGAIAWNKYNSALCLYPPTQGNPAICSDSTWVPLPQPIPSFGREFYVINVEGLLFYTDSKKEYDAVKDVKTVASMVALAASARVGMTITQEVLGSRVVAHIGQLFAARTAADNGRMGAVAAGAANNAMLGAW